MQLNAYSSHVINAYAVSVYDKDMHEENIQGKRQTSKDYNGVVYSKIYVFGTLLQARVHVKIGNSIGSEIDQRAIVKNNLHIGNELIFKHSTVKSGYLEVSVDNKIFDQSLYVK